MADGYMGTNKGAPGQGQSGAATDYNSYDIEFTADGTEGAQDNAAQNRDQPVPRPPRFAESFATRDAVVIAQSDARRQYPDTDPDDVPQTLQDIHDRWMEQRNVRSLPGGSGFSVSSFDTEDDGDGRADFDQGYPEDSY